MWNDIPTPIIVAHRGDKACAPENTLSAFKEAAKKGADAVEFDVKLTIDGQVIVIHDQTVDRTTNGKGNVANLSFSELRRLDAGLQFPGQFPEEKIPSLEEVFETVGKLLYMNIELTNYSTPSDTLVLNVVEMVKKHGMQRRVLFSSFLPWNLRKARTLLPEVPCGLLTMRGWMGFWGRSFGWRDSYDALHPFFTDLNAGLINRVHAAGKQVNVWTVYKEVDMKRMIGLGVDGLITGNLSRALNLLGRGN